MIDTTGADTKTKVYPLNALRGYSAIFVVFYHMVGNGQFLDPFYKPAWFKYFYAHDNLRILIFFVISGAVIQLSNKTPLTVRSTPVYLKKRLTRLYPMYAAGLIAALLVSKVTYSWLTIAGNFAFLQVLIFDVILANGPIWTLHYEVLFYLLFIPISMHRFNPVIIFTLALAAGLVNYLLYPKFGIPLVSAYCIGFSFWLLGLIIVKYFPVDLTRPLNNIRLVSFLFLITAIPYLNGPHVMFYQYSLRYFEHELTFPYDGNIAHWFRVAFSVYDFSVMPICFMAVILFSNRQFKYRNVLMALLQLIPAFTLIRLYSYSEILDLERMIFPMISYGISIFLFFTNWKFIQFISGKIVSFFIWMGGISYGMYIIHGPILVFFNRVHFFSGTLFTSTIRVIVYLSITFIAAYLLEKKFHVWVVSRLGGKKIAMQNMQP